MIESKLPGGTRGAILRGRAAFAAAAMLLLASRGFALDPDSSLAKTLSAIEGTPLTLSAAQDAARANATSLRDAAAALAAARGALRSERGRFDPELFGEVSKSGDERLTSSLFSGASVLETETAAGLAGARVRLPIGTELSVSLNAVRTETNSSFASLDPQYDAFGQLSIVQPLLAGFGPSAKGGLSAAQRRREAAEAAYEDARMALEATVEWAFWDLYAAERDYAVGRLILEQGRSLLSEAELRARAGLVGPGDVASARAFVAEQEQALLDREERLDRLSDALATLMGRRPGAGSPRFRPAETPPSSFDAPEAERLVSIAVERNRSLQSLRQNEAAARALHAAARWDALPQVDLFGAVGGSGLSGTPRDVVFGGDTLRANISGTLGDAWSQVAERDYPSWSAGLLVTIPITFRESRGERDRLAAEAVRAEQATIAAARAVEERVRAAHRELSHSLRRLSSAQDGVDASQEQVRIGVIEFRNGRTTAFELVRLGADLASAQQRYSQALVRAAKAAAEIRYLTSGAYPGGI